MKTKTKWTIGFLGVTALAVFLELFAVFDGNPETLPWTNLFVDNIPFQIGFSIVCLFAGWLVKHFYTAYKNRK